MQTTSMRVRTGSPEPRSRWQGGGGRGARVLRMVRPGADCAQARRPADVAEWERHGLYSKIGRSNMPLNGSRPHDTRRALPSGPLRPSVPGVFPQVGEEPEPEEASGPAETAARVEPTISKLLIAPPSPFR